MTEFLPTLWFILIAVLWSGYLILDGFDLGVGMLMKLWARNESQRRVLLNTIGPVWDGNEVWLITAAGAMFAAFPLWYASLFAALYIPLTFTLVGLIFRAVAIEYRGKAHTSRGRNIWNWALSLGSFTAAFSIGAMLALTTTGLPLDANGDRVGGAFAWFNGYAVVGGLATVGLSLAMGWAWLGLKTDGTPRRAAQKHLNRWLVVLLLPLGVWAGLVVVKNEATPMWLGVLVAVITLILGWIAIRAQREGWAFIALALTGLVSVGTIFATAYPAVLPSTLNPEFSLTIDTAASGTYTLGVMAWVAAFFVPLVLLYTGWAYYNFRQRLDHTHIPESTVVTPV